MNHHHARVKLSAESVVSTAEPNLINLARFIRRAATVLLPNLILLIWFGTAAARIGTCSIIAPV